MSVLVLIALWLLTFNDVQFRVGNYIEISVTTVLHIEWYRLVNIAIPKPTIWKTRRSTITNRRRCLCWNFIHSQPIVTSSAMRRVSSSMKLNCYGSLNRAMLLSPSWKPACESPTTISGNSWLVAAVFTMVCIWPMPVVLCLISHLSCLPIQGKTALHNPECL